MMKKQKNGSAVTKFFLAPVCVLLFQVPYIHSKSFISIKIQ